MSVDLSRQHVPVSAAETLRSMADVAESRGYEFDCYGTGASLQAFEARVAAMMGKEAGVFSTSGTMVQQAVLGALTWGAGVGARPKVYCHATSHLVHQDCLRDGADLNNEFAKRAMINLPEYEVVPFGSSHRVLTCHDTETAFMLGGNICNTLVVIEVPQRMNGGGVSSFEELRKISEYCRSKGIKLHMDGARLWEAQPFLGVTFAEVAALFDTVYVSWYKGVGALASAMLLGPEDVVKDVRATLGRRGGKLFTFGPLALSAELNLDETLPRFEARYRRLCEMVQVVKSVVAALGPEAPVPVFDPPEPQSAMIHVYLPGDRARLERIHDKAAQATGVTLWNKFRGKGHPRPNQDDDDPTEWSYFEWSIGNGNVEATDDAVRAGWATFLALCATEDD